jgi:hypothetical protein
LIRCLNWRYAPELSFPGGAGSAAVRARSGGEVTGVATGPRRRRLGATWPRTNPTAIAAKARAIKIAGPGPDPALETNPVKARPGPVVAVSVSALVQDSFQIAVFRSCVNSAPGADVISCGTVNAKVIVKTDAS